MGAQTCRRLTGLTLSAAVALGVSGPAIAEPLGCRLAPGVYLTLISDIEGVFASRSLISLLPGGVMMLTDSRQGGQEGVYDPFTSGQGAWSCDQADKGKLEIRAMALTFTASPGRSGAGLGRVDYEAMFDPAMGSMEGTLSLHLTNAQDLEGSDPLADPGEVLEVFRFSAVRVEAP